jgi:hypothetical protein
MSGMYLLDFFALAYVYIGLLAAVVYLRFFACKFISN